MLARLEADQRRLRAIESSAHGLTVGAFLYNSSLPAKKLELGPTTFENTSWSVWAAATRKAAARVHKSVAPRPRSASVLVIHSVDRIRFPGGPSTPQLLSLR